MNSSDSRQGTRFCINPSPSAIYIDSYLFVIATAVLQHSLGVNSSYGTCEAMSTQVMAFAKPWLPQIGSMVPYGDMLQLRGTSLYYIYYIYSPMPHLWLAFKRYVHFSSVQQLSCTAQLAHEPEILTLLRSRQKWSLDH